MTGPDPVAGFRARNQLIARVKAELHGRGLDFRDRDNALVITHPGDPEQRRVYITYATGEVSLYRPAWDYLGHLSGPGSTGDPDTDPVVDAAAIVAALTTTREAPGAADLSQDTPADLEGTSQP